MKFPNAPILCELLKLDKNIQDLTQNYNKFKSIRDSLGTFDHVLSTVRKNIESLYEVSQEQKKKVLSPIDDKSETDNTEYQRELFKK